MSPMKGRDGMSTDWLSTGTGIGLLEAGVPGGHQVARQGGVPAVVGS
jgi:hypothetical protein